MMGWRVLVWEPCRWFWIQLNLLFIKKDFSTSMILNSSLSTSSCHLFKFDSFRFTNWTFNKIWLENHQRGEKGFADLGSRLVVFTCTCSSQFLPLPSFEVSFKLNFLSRKVLINKPRGCHHARLPPSYTAGSVLWVWLHWRFTRTGKPPFCQGSFSLAVSVLMSEDAALPNDDRWRWRPQ